MRRKDGLPIQRKPVRYLVFPPGQLHRVRPLPGSGQSHVALSWRNPAVKEGGAQRQYRRTLCGRVYHVNTAAWMRLDVRRYYAREPIEWGRVTCEHCLKFRDRMSE